MKLSAIRAIKEFCGALFSTPDWRDVATNIGEGADDFTIDNVRFIAEDAIDAIQAAEMSDDLYVLGYFNADCLSDVIGIDRDVIKAMQEAGAFEAVGKLIISLGKLEELQKEYSTADGYGHHFNGYDFGEEYARLNGRLYYVFDNH